MNYLAPSILSADFTRLGEQVALLEQSGLKMLHIDVMDGMFVPSIFFGMPVIQSLRKKSNLFFDVHLMIERPERYLETFAEIGADGITVHAESTTHLDRVVHQIKDLGKKCSVALNPATPLQVLDYVLPELDMVLIMTVNPGFGGQQYIEAMNGKIRTLRDKIEAIGKPIDIQVDGGVKFDNCRTILEAGANVLVTGSSVFLGDMEKNVAEFKKLLGTCD